MTDTPAPSNKLLGTALGLGAIVGVVIVGVVFAMAVVERYNPDLRPSSQGTGRQAPSGGQQTAPSPQRSVTTHNGKQWEPTVDCAAMGGTRMINPKTNRPSCYVP